MRHSEIFRKLIHLLGLIYIPAYDILGREGMIMAVGIITAIATFIEILRHKYKILPEFLLRGYEKRSIGAYIHFGIAAFTITVLLPRDACFVGIVVGSLGDGISGILKHLFSLGKNVASFGMFLSSAFTLYFLNLISPPALIAIAVGVLAERLEKVGNLYINDNLTVPLTSALAYYVLEIVL